MDPRHRNALLIAAGVVLAFLVGFGWQYTRAEAVEDHLETTTREATFQRLQATLAAAALDARAGAHEVARQHASRFYSGLQDALPDAPAGAAEELGAILATRDAMITSLSRSDPEVADQLHRLFLRWRLAFDEPVGPSPPGPDTAADTAGS